VVAGFQRSAVSTFPLGEITGSLINSPRQALDGSIGVRFNRQQLDCADSAHEFRHGSIHRDRLMWSQRCLCRDVPQVDVALNRKTRIIFSFSFSVIFYFE